MYHVHNEYGCEVPHSPCGTPTQPQHCNREQRPPTTSTHTHCSPVLLPSILTTQVDARAVSLPLKGRTRTATFTDDMATSSLQQSSCRTTTLQATQVLGRRKSRQDKPCFCPSLGKVCRLRPHHVVARRGGFSNPPRAAWYLQTTGDVNAAITRCQPQACTNVSYDFVHEANLTECDNV